MKVTISDVAKASGFGIATVSRALNDSGSVKPNTKQKIVNTAEQLGFQFNELARSLQTQNTRTIGVIVPTLQNPVFASAIQGIQAEAALHNYQVLFACVDYDEEEEINALNSFLAKKISAVIVTVANPDNSRVVEKLKESELPFCLIFNQTEEDIVTVGVDNLQAAQSVGDLLIQAGHQHIAFVAINFESSERSYLRYQGIKKSYQENNLPEPQLLEIDFQKNQLKDALNDLLQKNSEPTTAIFASNDLLAIKCIKALKELGKNIPKDISVVGFDGIDIGELIEPSLTTVSTPNQSMGARAAKVVLGLIAGDVPDTRRVYLNFEVILRESLISKE